MNYKKLVSVFLAVCVVFSFASCRRAAEDNNSTNAAVPENTSRSAYEDVSFSDSDVVLTVYFSYDETSKTAAEIINSAVGGELYGIETVNGYSEDATARLAEARSEAEKNVRPALKNRLSGITPYYVVFLCFPMWEGTLPMAVYTFLEDYDLRDRVVIPVCAAEDGSGCFDDIKEHLPGAAVLDGLSIAPGTAEENRQEILSFVMQSLYG